MGTKKKPLLNHGTRLDKSKKTKLGFVGNENTIFMCMDAGSAKSPEHGEFELMYTLGGTPIVRSKKSQNCFYMNWSELVSLAIDQGIMLPFDEVPGELRED